jgi:hypothetical protein
MKFLSLMTLSEYKLCLNDGILDSGINSFQVTFFFAKITHFYVPATKWPGHIVLPMYVIPK